MAKKSQPIYQITRRGLIVWGCLIVFISAWTFILGVLMGRGTAPVSFDLGGMEEELVASKAAQLAAQEEIIVDSDGSGVKAPDVEYPEILRGKIDDPDEARATRAEKPKASATSPKVKRRRVPQKPKVIKYPVPEVPSAPATPRRATEPAADKSKKAATTAGAQAKPTQATPPAPPPAKPDPAPGAPKPYTLQAISVQDQVAAKKMVATLRNKGFAAFLTAGEIPGKGTWYRVRVGGYENRAEAEPIIRRLQAEGIEPLLIRQ